MTLATQRADIAVEPHDRIGHWDGPRQYPLVLDLLVQLAHRCIVAFQSGVKRGIAEFSLRHREEGFLVHALSVPPQVPA